MNYTVNDITPEERSILRAFEESDGERLYMSDIREQTGLDESQRHYRMETLVDKEWCEKSYDDDATTAGQPPMKYITLTDRGREIILEDQQSNGQTYEDTQFDAEARVEELEQKLAVLEAQVEENKSTIATVRDAVNNDIVSGIRMLHDAVGRLEYFVEDVHSENLSDVDVAESKRKQMNRRLNERKNE